MSCSRYVRAAIVATGPVAIVIGILSLGILVGYLLDMEALYRPVAQGPATHPMTALVALLCAVAVSALSRNRQRPRATGVGLALSGLAAGICMLRILAEVAGLPFFEALTPFPSVVAADLAAGRGNSMGTNTAIMFLFIALAAIAQALRDAKVAQLVAFTSLALPMVSVTGYAYGLPTFYGDMSLMTVTLGLPLGIAASALSANRGILRALLSPFVSGRIARVQIMLGYFVPFLIGYLLLKAVGEQGDTSLFGVFAVAISWFVILLVAISAVIHENIDHRRRLHERALARTATIDALTGVATRLRFDQALTHEMHRSRRSGMPFALIMVDIDHFKRVNDTGGHVIGDRALKAVAAALKGSVRATDMVGRFGGEEFAIVLPRTGVPGARHVAESLRSAVQAVALDPWDGHDGRLTASFGCACSDGCRTPQEVLRLADQALYKAKENGRNRVEEAASSEAEHLLAGSHNLGYQI